MTVKRCTKCGEKKAATVEFFYRQGAGVTAQCRACQSAAMRAKHVPLTEDETARRKAARAAARSEYLSSPEYKIKQLQKDRRAYWKRNAERRDAYDARNTAKADGKRICTLCNTAYPATNEFFRPDKRTVDGCTSWCKLCASAREVGSWAAKPLQERVEIGRRRYEATKNSPELSAKKREYGKKSYVKAAADPIKREELNARRRAWYAANIGTAKGYQKAYRSRHANDPAYRERIRLRGQRQYWGNPVLMRARNAANRAKRVQAEGAFTPEDVQVLFKSQGARCYYCAAKVGRDVAPWEIDHLIPLARGGSNSPENLVLACALCNRRKWAKMPHEFMPEKFPPPSDQAAD